MKTYDYIIIGAGAAGCVIANRLSKDPAIKVALIEAGPSDRAFPVNWKTTIPIGNIFLLPHERYNWQHTFSGGASVYHREIACPRGRLLGGSTSVNGTVYIRGHHSDYDEWAALGNEGWGYQDTLPWFLRQEKHWRGGDQWHGADGELDVQRPTDNHVLAHAFVDAAAEAGFSRNDDFNGVQQDGFGLFDLNQRQGVRLSSSRAFLHPVMQRSNLDIYPNALVERIEIHNGRAVGISGRQGSHPLKLRASTEVVVSGGAINSPQLLMLSGIGDPKELERAGVHVVHALSGVGENLQDHPTVSVAMENPGAESYALSMRTLPRALLAPWSYLFGRRGMLSSNGAEAGGFLNSRAGLSRPDLQMTFMVAMKENARTMPRRHGIVLHVAVLRPATRGKIRLRSSVPTEKPELRPNFLDDRADVLTLIEGLRQARHVFKMPALARYTGAEVNACAGKQSDSELEEFVRSTVATTYHPVGTCKMGPASDVMSVVDPRLKVHGIEGLRVADASIMPNIIGGNTSAPSMMIGERAAHFMLNGR